MALSERTGGLARKVAARPPGRAIRQQRSRAAAEALTNTGEVTATIAEWAAGVRVQDIPEAVRAYTKMLLLDGIACAVLGSHREAGKQLYELMSETDSSRPEGSVWGHGRKLGLSAATLINAASAHTTNVGDTHRASLLHTNYVTPPAAIGVAEKEGRSGSDVLAAIVAGNEVGIRTGLATHVGLEGAYFTREGRGWHSTGAIGAITAATAAGRVLRLNKPKMVQALVMGGTQLVGLYRPCGAYRGKHWFAGKAVANGVESAYLARAGFVAGYRVFEEGLCFGSGIISPVHDLPSACRALGDTWETLNVDMAIYPAKKYYYAHIDAVLDIVRTEHIKFDAVAKIVLRSAFTKSHAFGTFTAPRNATEAFNNLRFTIAAAVHDGQYGFAQLTPRKYKNPAILAFARDRTEVSADRELERQWPAKSSAVAEIEMKDGRRFARRVDHHLGEVANPLSKQQVEDKFFSMTSMLKASNAKRIVRLVDELEDLSDIRKLTRLFRQCGTN